MTIVQEIREWFAGGCLFFKGVALYQRIGGEVPVSYFTGYYNATFIPPLVKDRLKHCLKSYLKQHSVAAHETNINKVAETTPVLVTKEKVTPEAIQKLHNRAKKLHKQHALLHSNLRQSDSPEDRYEICVLIMEDVIPQLDGIYDRIKTWEKTGKLPAVSDNDVVRNTVKKMNRRLSIIPRISRLKKFLENDQLDKKLKQKYEKELLDKQLELAKIENELEIA
jgi:hypothetical protein